jgi:hypothetical protein
MKGSMQMSTISRILILACAGAALASASQAAESGCPRAVPAPGVAASAGPAAELFGTISQIQGNQLTVETRTGKQVTIDATPALNAQQSTPLIPGRAVDILGTLGPAEVVRADVIRQAKPDPAGWDPDCMPAQ